MDSENYAKALFLSAKESNNLEIVKKSFAAFVRKIEKEDFSDFPVFPSNFLNLLKILKDKEKSYLLYDIYKRFCLLCDKDSGILSGKIFSPFKLDESQITKISSILSNKLNTKVILENSIDKKLIGGIAIQIGDKVIDMSFEKKLSLLKDKILKNGE